jgi:hypothetical protein
MKSLNIVAFKSGTLLLISLFSILISCTNGRRPGNTENNLENLGLKGEVRTITETVFRVDTNSTEIQDRAVISRAIRHFNRDGNPNEEKYLSPDGTQRGRTTYKYDEKNNLILKVDLDHSGDIEYRESYKYDQDGKEIERNGIRPPNSQWNIVVYYDKSGNLKKGSYHALVKSQTTTILFRYDDKGNKVEEKILGSEKYLISRRVNIFDEGGYLNGSDLYDSKDTLIQRTIFKYDGSGNLIEEKQGQSRTGFNTSRSWEFDEKGDLIRETLSYGENKTNYTFNYFSYDKHGNWLVKTESFFSPKTGEVNTIITERVIGYY